MAKPVIERVPLSSPQTNRREFDVWGAGFARSIISAFQEHGTRLNLAITDDGETKMKSPLILATFTIATLPTAADFKAGIIYVSDGAAGQKFRGSDGTGWVNLG